MTVSQTLINFARLKLVIVMFPQLFWQNKTLTCISGSDFLTATLPNPGSMAVCIPTKWTLFTKVSECQSKLKNSSMIDNVGRK